jgi:hypothetical protein
MKLQVHKMIWFQYSKLTKWQVDYVSLYNDKLTKSLFIMTS